MARVRKSLFALCLAGTHCIAPPEGLPLERSPLRILRAGQSPRRAWTRLGVRCDQGIEVAAFVEGEPNQSLWARWVVDNRRGEAQVLIPDRDFSLPSVQSTVPTENNEALSGLRTLLPVRRSLSTQVSFRAASARLDASGSESAQEIAVVSLFVTDAPEFLDVTPGDGTDVAQIPPPDANGEAWTVAETRFSFLLTQGAECPGE